MTIKITNLVSNEYYDVESEGVTRRLSYKFSTNTMNIPIPDEDNAEVMKIGGTNEMLTLEWIIAETDQTSFYGKINTLMSFFGTGTMGDGYSIYIDFWNFNKNGVISRFDITQNEGEGYIATVSVEFILGNVITMEL